MAIRRAEIESSLDRELAEYHQVAGRAFDPLNGTDQIPSGDGETILRAAVAYGRISAFRELLGLDE